jgi:hypothetical protein
MPDGLMRQFAFEDRSLAINVPNLILALFAGAEPMSKQEQRSVPTAKPSGKRIDIAAAYQRVMKRFPRIMARLAQ